MNLAWTSWLLGGALVASLAWNLRAKTDGAPAACTTRCADVLDFSDLGLSEEQVHALEAWKTGACEQSCRVEADASSVLSRLQVALRDPSVPPERLHELAAEVSQQRAHSLDECIDSIVAVRRVLTRDQLATLLDRCCVPNGCAK